MEIELRAIGCEERCPACRHRGWPRGLSEKQKREWISTRLAEHLNDPGLLSELVGPNDSQRWNYRSKVCLRAEWVSDAGSSSGRWKFGLRVAMKGTQGWKPEYEVIDIPKCPIHSPEVRLIHGILAESLPDFVRVPLVFVLVSGALVTLVLKSSQAPEFFSALDGAPWVARLKESGVRGIFLNLNPSAGERVISSKGWKHVWGEAMAQDSQGRWYGPDSFQQLIPSLHERALSEARDFLGPVEGDSVIDLYSGGGRSLQLWKAAGARLIGVELGGEAVRCAEKNLGPGHVLRGKASERIPQLEEWCTGDGRRLLFANPPRLGLEEEVSHWIGESYRPEKIAYLSCSAGTLSRDLSLLRESGYALRKITPYDFFPQTHHVEALALLERTS